MRYCCSPDTYSALFILYKKSTQKTLNTHFIDHEVEVGIVDVLDLAHVVGLVAATGTEDARTVVAVVAPARIAKVRVANHAHAASPKIGKKTVVPSPGKNLFFIANCQSLSDSVELLLVCFVTL